MTRVGVRDVFRNNIWSGITGGGSVIFKALSRWCQVLSQSLSTVSVSAVKIEGPLLFIKFHDDKNKSAALQIEENILFRLVKL